MAKVSAKYEVMTVYSLKDGEEALKALLDKFKATIEKHAEAVEINEDWGKRKLAYTIKGKTHGYYVIFYYKAESNVAASLEAAFKINENVLRWMTLVDYPMSETVYDQSQAQSTEEVTPIDSEDGEAE